MLNEIINPERDNMRRVISHSLSLLLALAALAPWVALAQAPLVLSTTSNGPAGPFELPLTEDSGDRVLYLRNPGTEPLANATLSGTLLDANSSPVPDARFEFLTQDGASPLRTLSLAANQAIAFLLRVSNVPAGDNFQGTISLQQSAEKTQLGTFTETREQPDIRIQAPAAGTAITQTVTTSAFTLPLSLSELKNEGRNVRVTLELLPLVRADGGKGLPPEWNIGGKQTETLTLNAGGSKTFTLAGKLPERTKYAATLLIRYLDQVETYRINLERVAPLGIETLGATADGKLPLQAGGRELTREVVLRVRDGQSTIDQLKVLLGSLRREDGTPLYDAQFSCDNCADLFSNLSAGQLIPLGLSGKNLTPGTYLADLMVQFEDNLQTTPRS